MILRAPKKEITIMSKRKNHSALPELAVNPKTLMSHTNTKHISFPEKSARILAIGTIVGMTLIGPSPFIAPAAANEKTSIVIQASKGDNISIISSSNELPAWVSHATMQECPGPFCESKYTTSCIFSHTMCEGVYCALKYKTE